MFNWGNVKKSSNQWHPTKNIMIGSPCAWDVSKFYHACARGVGGPKKRMHCESYLGAQSSKENDHYWKNETIE